MDEDDDYVPSDEDGLDDDDMDEDFEDETAFLTASRGHKQDAGEGMASELLVRWSL